VASRLPKCRGLLSCAGFPMTSTTSSAETMPLLSTRAPKWIWDTGSGENRYVWFRRTFDLSENPEEAELRITVDGRYSCWVNGVYLGQGPVPYRPPWHPVDIYKIHAHLRPGKNVIAVLAHNYGRATHTSSSLQAGVFADAEIVCAGGKSVRLSTDATWKAKAADSWLPHSRRRSWATGFAEDFDARLEPQDWKVANFDDSDWEAAVPRAAKGTKFYPRPTPLLEEYFLPASSIHSVARTGSAADRPEGISVTAWIDKEPHKPAPASLTRKLENALASGKPLSIPAGDGIAITFDLGREWSGQIEFELDAPAGCLVEGVGAERLVDGRAVAGFKNADYAFRYHTREGRQAWRQFTYNGLRYLVLVIRPRKAPVTIHRIGLWVRQSDLPIRGGFKSSDRLWNALYKVSVHTLQISTQEVQVDCPTREQAPYFGDAVWTGLWTAWLTGDTSHLRHLLFLGRTCQDKEGLLRGTPLTGLPGFHILYDYNLIYIWGVAVLYSYTGDIAEVRAALPSVERILKWFVSKLGNDGLVHFDAIRAFEEGKGVLFIDHNGLGWHIQDEPGIDRRGQNAALNLFLLKAIEVYLQLCKAARHTPRVKVDRTTVQTLRKAIHRHFWNPELRVFADARQGNILSDSVSEQTNALAVLFGIIPEKEGREVLRRVLRMNDRPVARCTPYFVIYLADAMIRTGQRLEAVDLIESRWKPMLDAGATTWWECFAGDHLDSHCHPWSSAPLWFALTGILGIQPEGPAWKKIRISPLRIRFPEAGGTVITPHGKLSISWKPRGKVSIDAPDKVKSRIELVP
jgi:alpha-L-rhamnosidase